MSEDLAFWELIVSLAAVLIIMAGFMLTVARMLNAPIVREISQLRADIDKRFDAVDKRFDSVDKRIDDTNKRLDRIEIKVEDLRKEISQVSARVVHIEALQGITAPEPEPV